MEEKILKTNVFLNDTLLNDSAEVPIDVDFTLPDYCPDISKIFKCRAVARIASKGMNGRTITVDGVVTITVFYCDTEGNLCSYEYQYPFSKSLDMNDECSAANLLVNSKCEYINCRAVTGRKIDIHGAVGIYIRVFRRKCNEIISDIDDVNIEQRRSIAAATVPMGYSEKYLLIEEDIQIGQGQPDVGRILRYDAKPCVKESKILNGKIVVKGDMSVWILYCPESGGNPQSVKSVIPFSQIIDMEGATDSCECETKCELAFLEIKPRTVEGTVKCLNLSAKLWLSSEAYCENEVPVISDAFSRKYQTDMVCDKVCFESICEKINESFHCKKSIELNGPITSVCDIWCDMQSVSTKFEKDNMFIYGTVIACLITGEQNGGTGYFEKAIEFEYKYPLKCKGDNFKCNPEIDIISCGYTITSAESVELRIDLGINAAVYESKSTSLITDIKIEKDKPAIRPVKCAMTIYFTAENELVWDVAKHYGASVEEVMKINGLSDDILPPDKMLLIPIM